MHFSKFSNVDVLELDVRSLSNLVAAKKVGQSKSRYVVQQWTASTLTTGGCAALTRVVSASTSCIVRLQTIRIARLKSAAAMNITASQRVSLAFSGLVYILLVVAVSASTPATAATAGTGSFRGGVGASVERPRRSVPKITAKVSKHDLDVLVATTSGLQIGVMCLRVSNMVSN
jgi:hypothetical protein